MLLRRIIILLLFILIIVMQVVSRSQNIKLSLISCNKVLRILT